MRNTLCVVLLAIFWANLGYAGQVFDELKKQISIDSFEDGDLIEAFWDAKGTTSHTAQFLSDLAKEGATGSTITALINCKSTDADYKNVLETVDLYLKQLGW